MPWKEIEFIGLDLDGTLYDEMDFISQVYESLARYISVKTNKDYGPILEFMITLWRGKGSSYSRIFEEAIGNSLEFSEKKRLVNDCLELYRSFKPNLQLTNYVEKVLNAMSVEFNLFLVTDGSPLLQESKFRALDLGRWIKDENVGISGRMIERQDKPSTSVLGQIRYFDIEVNPKSVVYFGDRVVDYLFSQNAGFHFQKVKCLLPVSDNLELG